jgi:hypothetical protein
MAWSWTAVAAILLPFPRHPVNKGLLGAIVERVDRRGHQALERRLGEAYFGFVGPGEEAAADRDFAHPDPALDSVDVKLEPAQALEVETLEPVLSLTADEAGPGVEMSVEEGRAPGSMGLVDEKLDGRSVRGVDGETRPTDDLLFELEGECAAPSIEDDFTGRARSRRRSAGYGKDRGGRHSKHSPRSRQSTQNDSDKPETGTSFSWSRGIERGRSSVAAGVSIRSWTYS